MPLDYLGLVAVLGLSSDALVWLCRLISDLRRPDED